LWVNAGGKKISGAKMSKIRQKGEHWQKNRGQKNCHSDLTCLLVPDDLVHHGRIIGQQGRGVKEPANPTNRADEKVVLDEEILTAGY